MAVYRLKVVCAEPIAIEYAGVPYPLRTTLLRVHCLQLWNDQSDPGVEELLYEVESLRRFARRLSGPLPDEPTTLKFRHLLERRGLSLSTRERTVC